MTFQSILFAKPEDTVQAPDFLVDLGLDQIIDTITAATREYNLKPFFYTPLKDIDAVNFRHEVARDLENLMLFEHVKSFARNMRTMREHLGRAEKLYYKYEKERSFVDAVDSYCNAVTIMVRDLFLTELKSRGFLAFREYLAHYAESAPFTSLLTRMTRIKANLAAVTYCVLIDGDAVTVRRYDSEIDYSADVATTFEKFKQGAVKDHRLAFSDSRALNTVEARVLEGVAALFPDIFLDLDQFCAECGDYLDRAIARFEREVHFYIAYLEYVNTFKHAGLTFCYPALSTQCKAVCDFDAFDAALAYKRISEHASVVCNDFHLDGSERIFVVSGPNQGGKTTFARTFGQLHYLASIGCPVPGREARLFFCDRIFTHFEREENINDLRGKLQDDLIRIHSILERATGNSIVILNEIFTSTTLHDALFLSEKVLATIVALDLLCVWVTFIDELASFGEQTVSMVSTVVPDNPSLRTYKVRRRPADGLSYAMSIAEKYCLTRASLKQRIRA
jgi:DNA mismatch repair protein MutS